MQLSPNGKLVLSGMKEILALAQLVDDTNLTPPQISGLQLWLKADSLTYPNNYPVSVWTDDSGNGNDATQPNILRQPVNKTNVLNGHSGILFDGVDDILRGMVGIGNTNVTLFVVSKHAEDAAGCWFEVSSAYGLGIGGLWTALNSKLTGLYPNVEWLGTTANLSPSDVASMTIDGDGHPELFIKEDSALTSNVVPNIPSGDYTVGSEQEDFRPFAGYICEIILYDALLDVIQRSQVNTYLVNKVRIVNQMTPTLPYDFPLIPLEYLRERIGYSPYLWWGLSNERVIHSSACNSVILEYAWQGADQIGRSTMRQYLLDAELDMRRELKFSVAPHYAEETKDYLQLNLLAQNRLYNVTQFGAGDPFARWTSVQLSEGYVNALGYEDLELIDDPTITITDENDDDLYDTFTAVVNTSETDPLKLAVYFPEDERLDGDPPSEQWRIQPVKITIESGVATIIGRSWTIVRPILYQKATAQQPLDPDTLANYIETIEVYSRTTNPTGTDITNCQATMEWETTPLPLYPFLCPPTTTQFSTDPATVGYTVGRCGIRNSKLGEVTPAQATYNPDSQLWNETFPIWQWRPDRVKLRYNAGYPLDANGHVNKTIRSAVVDLAIASMPNRMCACDVANKVLHELQWDLARTANGVEQYATTFQQLNNIFGTKRGQVRSWQRVKHMVLHRGVTY